MKLHETIYAIDDRAINVAVGPENGPPLIMFHGVTRRWQSFVPVLAELGLRFELFVVDFPGHGKSDRRSRYRVIDYVDYVSEMLARPPFSTQQECYVYGHSLGAMVAAAMPGRLGAKVKAVMLEDPPFHTMGERIGDSHLLSYFQGVQSFAGTELPLTEAAAQFAEIRSRDPQTGLEIRAGDSRDAAALRFTARCLKDLDPRVFEPIVAGQWLDGYDWEAITRSIECPSLLLQADSAAGGMLTDDDAARFAELATDCTRVRFDGIGHMINWQDSQGLLRAVQNFTESLLD